MDSAKIVKLTNRVAFFSVALLAYWVFIFVSITVFDFKVFRENITQAFYLSILGVFALLGAAIILNIMLNMTRVADHFERREATQSRSGAPGLQSLVVGIASFPLIFGLLFLGDYRSSQAKKAHLVNAAEFLTAEHAASFEALADYTFNRAYAEKTAETLKVLTKVEEQFPHIKVIVRDSINRKPVSLAFSKRLYHDEDEQLKKVDFLLPASKKEREYLHSVFSGEKSDILFSANDGNYELWFPVNTANGIIVLYVSDWQRYGKLGS